MKPTTAVSEILVGTKAILLDFDGPVCSIFAHLTAPTIATELRRILTDSGVVLPTTPTSPLDSDPLAVLEWTANHKPELIRSIDDGLRDAELLAAKSARPTPHAADAIIAAHHAGRPVAIVSNNSEPAIQAYLNAHNLNRHIGTVIGRPYAEPDRMKPNPEPILRAASILGVEPQTCVLIGDSPNDIHAAHNAGALSIGFANRTDKHHQLIQTGADAIIANMGELTTALNSH